MSKLTNPINSTLFITNYYDKLINQIDIYAETLLEAIDANQATSERKKPARTLIPVSTTTIQQQEIEEDSSIFCKAVKDPYNDKYTSDDETNLVGNESTLDFSNQQHGRDFVHSTRMALIDYVRRLKEQNIKWHEKESKSMNQRTQIDAGVNANVDEFASRILMPKFSFLLEINQMSEELFKMYLIEIDFYLTQEEIQFLK